MLESPAYRVLSQSAHRAISRLELELCYHGGRARIVDDPAQIRALWGEGFRVWFPDGPDSPNIALLAIVVEVTKTWTKPASVLTYAYYYLRARTTGEPPSPSQIAKQETIRT